MSRSDTDPRLDLVSPFCTVIFRTKDDTSPRLCCSDDENDDRPPLLLDLAQIASLIAAPQLPEEDYSHVLEGLLRSVASSEESEDDGPAPPLISRENLRAAFGLLGEGFDRSYCLAYFTRQGWDGEPAWRTDRGVRSLVWEF